LVGLPERVGLGLVCSSFADSLLILRSSFAQGPKRKFFCWVIDKNFIALTWTEGRWRCVFKNN